MLMAKEIHTTTKSTLYGHIFSCCEVHIHKDYHVAKMNLELHQLDIKMYFLNGELKNDIFIFQLEGFQINKYEEKVYRLKKSHVWT